MKSSAWYQKLWERKLNELPDTGDVDKAWLGMKDLLDNQMPTDAGNVETLNGITTTKSIASKVGTWLGYILPAAAMIYGATYSIGIENSDKTKTKAAKIKRFQGIKTNTTNTKIDSLSVENVLKQTEISGSSIITSTTSLDNSIEPAPIQNKEYKFDVSTLLQENVRQSSLISEADISNRVIQVQKSIMHRPVANTTSGRNESASDGNVPVNYIPKYSYGISAGMNIPKSQTFYVGGFATLKVSSRMTANAGIVLYTPRSFKGTYNRPSYFRPDSNPSFTFTDSRKLVVVEAPLSLDYHITEHIKISGGPVISFPIKQSKVKLGSIQLARDTLFNGNKVIDIITGTKPKSINYGFRTGIGIQFGRLETGIHYQILTPYEFKNSLGTNKSTYKAIQIGISYRLGK